MGILENMQQDIADLDERLRRFEQAPEPQPLPIPDPEPPPPADDLDVDIWLHQDVSRWPVTSRITAVSFHGDKLSINHSKSGRWPVHALRSGVKVEGTPGIVFRHEGQVFAGTYEYLRPGQVTKRINLGNIVEHVVDGVSTNNRRLLERWRPRAGDDVGFYVSTPSRSRQDRTSDERSQIVWTTWGKDWR